MVNSAAPNLTLTHHSTHMRLNHCLILTFRVYYKSLVEPGTYVKTPLQMQTSDSAVLNLTLQHLSTHTRLYHRLITTFWMHYKLVVEPGMYIETSQCQIWQCWIWYYCVELNYILKNCRTIRLVPTIITSSVHLNYEFLNMLLTVTDIWFIFAFATNIVSYGSIEF